MSMKHRRRQRLWRWSRTRCAATWVRRVFGKEAVGHASVGDAGGARDHGPAHGRGDLRLLTSVPAMPPEPRGLVWVRLGRGSQWHLAGSCCGPRSREVVVFRGAFPPRDGGFVVCLECAHLSGCGEQAAAYVPPRSAELTRELPLAGSRARGARAEAAPLFVPGAPQNYAAEEAVPGGAYPPGTANEVIGLAA